MNKNIQELFDDFIKENLFIRKLSPITIQGYKISFKLLLSVFPDLKINELSPEMMAVFFEKIEKRERFVGKTTKTGLKNSTIATHRSKLNSFFQWLLAKGLIPTNPFYSIPYPRVEYTDRRYLKKEELEKVITAIITNEKSTSFITKRSLAIICAGAYCGLRLNEILNIKIPDLDMARNSIYIQSETSKSRISRTVYFGQEAKKFLKDYLKERREKNYTTPFLIVSDTTDGQLTKDGLKHIVKTIKKRSGVKDFHIHRLRHTYTVNAYGSGTDPLTISKLMGHKDPRQTNVYLRHIPEAVLKANVERMTLDNFF